MLYVVEETLVRRIANCILRKYKIFAEVIAELQFLPITCYKAPKERE
jgi:hypothetical protein